LAKGDNEACLLKLHAIHFCSRSNLSDFVTSVAL